MDFFNFLSKEGNDFKGRTLESIWSFSDEDIERTHDFIQILFPLNKPSESTFHGYYLDSEDLIDQIRSNSIARENILKSSNWYLSFLTRNVWLWNRNYDHNQLRITRVIECLRLLISEDEADKFYDDVLKIIKDNNKVNQTSLNFWKNA
jgi:Opioid growth factor receptor (OGFr) conserved region.